MDLSGPGLAVGLVLSSVGLGLFLFGKKQRRGPQLGCGVLLMLLPFLPVALWIQGLAGVLLLVCTRAIVRAGW